MPSGRFHFDNYGIHENRPLRQSRRDIPKALPPHDLLSWTRRDKILTGLDLDRLRGVEIGALSTPLVRSNEGHAVIVDHVSTEELIVKYANEPSVNTTAIAHVDAVWGTRTLKECLEGRAFDYVLASHVMEHVPDLITWLSEVAEILTNRGVVRLALPDRRYTFDYLRFETRSHDAIDAYLRKARAPLPRFILEHFTLGSTVDCKSAWAGSIDPKSLKRLASAKFAIETAKDAFDSNHYHDTHCWVFTPASFSELFLDLARQELISFSCEYLFQTSRDDFEFFVSLKKEEDHQRILETWSSLFAALSAGDLDQGFWGPK